MIKKKITEHLETPRANDDIDELVVALLSEVGELRHRLSVAGSILIDAIGADGPENADVTASRAAERIRRLEGLISDPIGHCGVCDSTDSAERVREIITRETLNDKTKNT